MKAALYRLSEFLEIKKRLLDIRENARGAIKTTDKDIAKTALIAKGFREAGQTAANTFRTFADKPEVDYSQKEQKHPITKAVLAPMKAVKKMLVSMELHLDASIDMMMAMMIYTWIAIMIMIGMTGIVIMPMVWMTQWMNLTRIGKYGRQIVKKEAAMI